MIGILYKEFKGWVFGPKKYHTVELAKYEKWKRRRDQVEVAFVMGSSK